MTIKEYRDRLAWFMAELARRAGLTYQTVSRVEKGKPAYFHTIAAIAIALGEEITVADIKGVTILE